MLKHGWFCGYKVNDFKRKAFDQGWAEAAVDLESKRVGAGGACPSHLSEDPLF